MANILVIEDDKELNAAYRLILSRDGHNVESAYNGSEALKVLNSFKPELILLDLLMPVKSGVEFIKEYNKGNFGDSKIVVFTNLENSPEINEALRLGAYKCIVKSWTAPRGLIKVVNELLNLQPSAARVPEN